MIKSLRPKTCRQCKNLFVPHTSLQIVCGIPCSLKQRDEDKRKKAEREKKKNRKEVMELRRRQIAWQHKQTQKVFNRMRVLQEFEWFQKQGKEPHCISCLKTKMDWACGHFVPVSNASSSLRYDPLNTYLQCNTYCNSRLSGNLGGNKNTVGYIEGLRLRFGDKEAKAILDHCKNDHKKIWAWEELEELRAGFAKEVRRLEQLGLSGNNP